MAPHGRICQVLEAMLYISIVLDILESINATVDIIVCCRCRL